MPKKPQLGSRGKPEESSRAILEAAIQEFAAEGVAGARTDSIASAAGVNKALLYYYYKDKETLYGAVLDEVFSGLVEQLVGVLRSEASPGEKVLRYLVRHFDYIAVHPQYPRLIQHEMMRANIGKSPHLERAVHAFFRPIVDAFVLTVNEGIASGELRQLDPAQLSISLTGINVFYFVSAPIFRVMGRGEPFSRQALDVRRAAALDFLAYAIFTDRETACSTAAKVLREVSAHATEAAGPVKVRVNKNSTAARGKDK